MHELASSYSDVDYTGAVLGRNRWGGVCHVDGAARPLCDDPRAEHRDLHGTGQDARGVTRMRPAVGRV